MTKFGFLFLFIFIGVTIVLLLAPRKGIFKPIDKGSRQTGGLPVKRLSYLQLLLFISGLISLVVLLLVRYIMYVKLN